MPKCNILDNHMCITVNGMWRPCCRFNENVQPWKERLRVDQHSFEEYRNSEFYKSIKTAQETGWHEGCKGCKIAEETGNSSTRLIFNKHLSSVPNRVEYIEISLSNECNLACRMCGPWASSTWQKLVIDNEEALSPFHKVSKHFAEINFEKLVSDIDLSHLKTIKLLGGEPFITPQTTDFLEYLDRQGILENIELQTNTNATFFPKKLVKYLSKFKHMSVSLSFDGVGKIGEYIRSKSSWETTLTVINQWKQFYIDYGYNTNSLKLASVINAYNVHHLPEMLTFANDIGIRLQYNIINGPSRLRLEALPIKYIEHIKKSLDTQDTQNVFYYLEKMEHNVEYQNELLNFTKELDKITNFNLSEVNVELAKYLDNY